MWQTVSPDAFKYDDEFSVFVEVRGCVIVSHVKTVWIYPSREHELAFHVLESGRYCLSLGEYEATFIAKRRVEGWWVVSRSVRCLLGSVCWCFFVCHEFCCGFFVLLVVR